MSAYILFFVPRLIQSAGRRGAEAHELLPALQAAARGWQLLRAQRRLPSDLQRLSFEAKTKITMR